MRKISYNQLAEAICQSISNLLLERWEEHPGQKMTERETPPSVTLKVYKQVKLTNETKKNGMVYPIDFHYQFLPCGNYGIRQQ